METLSNRSVLKIMQLVDDLVNGRYLSIEADGRSGRLNAQQIEEAIADYPGKLIPIPAGQEKIDACPVAHARGVFSVEVELWTEEEGESDLTLSLEVVESGDDVKIEIEDIHVL